MGNMEFEDLKSKSIYHLFWCVTRCVMEGNVLFKDCGVDVAITKILLLGLMVNTIPLKGNTN